VDTSKDAGQLQISRLSPDDYFNLHNYLEQLSIETRKRFGPHRFDLPSIIEQYEDPDKYLGYIAIDNSTGNVAAYSIVKKGILEHDRGRLQSYGLILNAKTDFTFAPSVADDWQCMGVGQFVFQFICSELKKLGATRIIPWGGVQCDNVRAVNYCKRMNSDPRPV
jgi:hypothetical protein